jgi:hypothetical protein
MSTGTIAEKRTLVTTTAPTTTTEILPSPESSPELSTTMVKRTEEELPSKTPTLVVEAPPTLPEFKPDQDKKCTYCKVDRIISLSIRGSITLVLLALCFHLIKSAK